MFANATISQVGISQRVVATLVACATVLFSIGVYQTAQAANFEDISDLLTDSHPSVTSGHTITFTIPASGTALADGDDLTITLEGFTVTGVNNTNTSVTVAGTPDADPTIGGVGEVITISNVAASAGDTIVVAIDDGVITNPVAGSYDVSIATPNDSGKTMVAIIDHVTVSASVDTSFVFTVDGLASTSPAVNGATLTGDSTATLLDYGELTAGNAEVLGQELTVTTNALNGFAVTVESDGNLRSANGADIDNFDDGSDVADVGTQWNSPTPDIDDENTWGHWGLTTDDGDLFSDGNYYTTDFASNDFIAASTSPRVVFAHSGPSDGTTVDKGSTTVAYQVEISALQEAADDYTAILTYIATPTF